MTIIAAVEAVALVAIVVLFLRHQRQQEQAWTVERRELMNRVQAPDRLPVPALDEDVDLPARAPDGWAEVGRVRVSQEWIEADD